MWRWLRQLVLATGSIQPRTAHAQLTGYPLSTPSVFPGEAEPCQSTGMMQRSRGYNTSSLHSQLDRSEPTHASRFCSLFDASWGKCYLWCQLEWHSTHSIQALCLACAFLSPWRRGNDVKKKKEKEMLVHCRILLVFTFLML